ncbi:MAG: 50S ribosomal protein L29 [Patescibacteria group bacterium]
MKRKEIQTLKIAGEAELAKNLKESQDRLRVVTFEYHAGKAQSSKEIHDIKKTIARIKTFLRERELGAKK